MKKITIMLLILTVSLSAAGCKGRQSEEVSMGSSSGCYVHVDEQIWWEESELILQGRIIAAEEYVIAADGSKITEDTAELAEMAVTKYQMQVDRVFKGEWTKENIIITQYRTVIDMTSEETATSTGGGENNPLQYGECIVGLRYYTNDEYGNRDGYQVAHGDAGFFVPDEQGTYTNISTLFSFSIDPAALVEK